MYPDSYEQRTVYLYKIFGANLRTFILEPHGNPLRKIVAGSSMTKYNGTTASILRRCYDNNRHLQRVAGDLAIHSDWEEGDFPQYLASEFNLQKALDGSEAFVTSAPINHRFLISSEMGKTYESGFNGYSYAMKLRRQHHFQPVVHYNGLSNNRFVNPPTEVLLNFYINGAGQFRNLTPQYIIEGLGLVIEKKLQQNIADGNYWPLAMFTEGLWHQYAPYVQPFVFANNLLQLPYNI